MLNLHFFLVIRDNFKILYIQINFPAYKDYLCSNFKWFDSHTKMFGENGKNVILVHIVFCIVVFSTNFSLLVTCMMH